MAASELLVGYYLSPIGKIRITSSEYEITSLQFLQEYEAEGNSTDQCKLIEECRTQLKGYFEGSLMAFDLPVAPNGTEFQRTVWDLLQKIPYGKTKSYAQMANDLGNPKVIRAAATANGANPIAIVIPCHRVIGSDGNLVGYAGGLWRKDWLLKHEAHFSGNQRQLEIF